MAYAGVKFIDKEHVEALEKFGICATVVSKKDRQANHPDPGDFATFLLDDRSSTSRRIDVKFIGDQELPDGGCISIYVPACHIYTNDF